MELLPLLALLICSVAITAFARRRGLPAPLLVTGIALAISFVPGVPDFEIEPEVILSIVLPPLLYSASLDVSVINFARSVKHITRLGIGLVAVTAAVVGFVAFWLIPDMTLPAALLLGAIVAPPDAVSATSIGRRLGLPRHVMTVLSGESLINDAASLTLFKVFILIVGGTSLTLGQDLGIFALAVGVGVAFGAVLGLVFHRLRMRVHDPVIETLMGLLVPFVAYLGAEELSGSGVLAVVVAGLIIGYNSPKTGYATRLQERPVWSAVDVLLEGFVFALIGLQLKTVVENLSESTRGVWPSIGAAAVVLVVVILIRPMFVFGTYYWNSLEAKAKRRQRQRLLDGMDPVERTRREERLRRWNERAVAAGRRPRAERPAEPAMTWRELIVVSWTSMRGVVTLAAAASVPAAIDGQAVPARDAIVFIAFAVTIGTLLLQGTTLPLVIRSLGVSDPGQEERDREEERAVLALSLQEGVTYLEAHRDELAAKFGDQVVERAISGVRRRMSRQNATDRDEQTEERGLGRLDVQRITEMRRSLITRQREIFMRERDAGAIDEEVMREVLLGLDAEELALDTSSLRRARG